MKFETVIKADKKWFDFNFKELVRYKDLIFMFVRRTFVSQYKQTVLGPLWAIIQPLLTTVVFTIVFGGIAKLPTDGAPTFIFYMCGNIAWTYFATSLTTTSNTFVTNAPSFGIVYFPSLVMPIATVISQFISFMIQFIFMIIILIFLHINGLFSFHFDFTFLLIPLILLQMAMLSLGFGVIISSLTTKYRDMAMLVSFGTQLWMYASPVAYASSLIPAKWLNIYMLNPMAPIIDTFRYICLGVGQFQIGYYLIGWLITLMILFVGLVLFNKVEKNFMDTI